MPRGLAHPPGLEGSPSPAGRGPGGRPRAHDAPEVGPPGRHPAGAEGGAGHGPAPGLQVIGRGQGALHRT
eukprot:4591906-Alexandrium_andersonii.AAC.1